MTLDVLVLGGTSWLGGAVASTARDRGHRVTCLARGESGPVPEGVDWVQADRGATGAYDAVAGAGWDVVVDVSWHPGLVASALAALGGSGAHWVYVSSGSVYADDRTRGQDESAPLHEPLAADAPADWDVYGQAKVACEQACLSALGPQRVLIARAGLIGGYGDRSDRLGWWPARVARAVDGEPVLVPPLAAPLQVVDVADLAAWLVRCGERRTAGAMNAVGPQTTVGSVLEASMAASGVRPRPVEADDAWLSAQGVAPWLGEGSLPLWLPGEEYAGFMTRRRDAAVEAGLACRPLQETVAATLAWELERGLERSRRAGLTPGRERELLGLLLD